MSGVNKVILVGRLGKDPEIRHLENGNTVANFSMATSEVYKDRNTGERKETTDWHNIVIWGKLAEVVDKYVKKGDQLYVEGKNKTRSWEKDGVTRYTTEVVANSMVMLGSSGGSSGQAAQQAAPVPTGKQDVNGNVTREEGQQGPTDDLPF